MKKKREERRGGREGESELSPSPAKFQEERARTRGVHSHGGR